MSVGTKLLQAAAGGGSDPVYVDDVFSCFLHTGGLSSPKVIASGIDLSGEGGLVWTKNRTSSGSHQLTDTVSGYRIESDDTAAGEASQSNVTFNSNGHSYSGYSSFFNGGSEEYVSWTFRKQEKFFDVVTYTGDGTTGRQIAHNLGSSPGMMFFKKTNGTGDWKVFHRSLSGSGLNGRLRLDNDGAEVTLTNNFFVSSTYFGSDYYNASGDEWVVYLFAHNEQEFGENSDEAIIHCGSYTGTGSSLNVDLGFEPQWVMIKRTNATDDWVMYDVMRGMPVGGDSAELNPNANTAENGYFGSSQPDINPYSTGFTLQGTSSPYNNSGSTYIYMAIRRPHKPASEFAATKLFDTNLTTSDSNVQTSLTRTDFNIQKSRGDSTYFFAQSRLTGNIKYLRPNATTAEANYSTSDPVGVFDTQGQVRSYYGSDSNVIWSFMRAKGFFDIVTYDGTGVANRSVTHNLGVTPDFLIIKKRNGAADWIVWSKDLTQSGTNGPETFALNQTTAPSSAGMLYATPTASAFTTYQYGATNASGDNYIAYLFASVDGISKIGSYTGTGYDLNVDCGFSAGARFVLIRRKDSTGDWYLYDSERGIVAGNDPYVRVNTSNAEVTNTDYIDPLSSGFTVTSSAPADLNASSGTYIFLAIA